MCLRLELLASLDGVEDGDVENAQVGAVRGYKRSSTLQPLAYTASYSATSSGT